MGIFGYLAAFSLSLTLSSFALAVTPILPVGLYEVEGEQGHFFLVGRDPNENPLQVYEIRGTDVVKLPVADSFVIVRDSAYDVRLENGWRLVLPDGGKRL